MQETQVRSLGYADLLEKGYQPTLVFLPGEFHGQRSLVGYSPWASRVRHNWEIELYHAHINSKGVQHTNACKGWEFPTKGWAQHSVDTYAPLWVVMAVISGGWVPLKRGSYTQTCFNIPCVYVSPVLLDSLFFFPPQRHHSIDFVKFPKAANLAAGLIGAELE